MRVKGGSKMKSVLLVWLAVLVLVVGAQNAKAEDISGPIAITKVIFEDSQLVGDVVCTMTDSPCIDFGVSHIKLRLNGFTITGPADPDTVPNPANSAVFCNPTSGMPMADGIRILNQTHAQILGPGMVQKFRRHGILIVGTIGQGFADHQVPEPAAWTLGGLGLAALVVSNAFRRRFRRKA